MCRNRYMQDVWWENFMYFDDEKSDDGQQANNSGPPALMDKMH
jgi:hypothetical protein